MYRLFVVLAAALAGAAILRRQEIRGDAERASKAIGDATSSVRSRIQRDSEDGDGLDVAETEAIPTEEGDADGESEVAAEVAATS